MKKVINKQLVDIPNFDVLCMCHEFQSLKATNGKLAPLQNLADPQTLSKDGITMMHSVLKEARVFDNALPSLFKDVYYITRYAALAFYLSKRLHKESQDFIVGDAGVSVRLSGDTFITVSKDGWVLTRQSGHYPFRYEMFSELSGYREFRLFAEMLLNSDTGSVGELGFYKQAFGDICKACGFNKSKIESELLRGTKLWDVPFNAQDSLFIDPKANILYSLDIYTKGYEDQETTETPNGKVFNLTCNVGDSGVVTVRSGGKVPIYTYTLFKKEIKGSGYGFYASPWSKAVLAGFDAVYKKILEAQIGGLQFPLYRGVIVSNVIVFSIGTMLYRCNIDGTGFDTLNENFSVVGATSKHVYLRNRSISALGLCEDRYFAFNPLDSKLVLCQVSYTRG